jgi:Family of unknown function (DUF5678)
MVVAEREDMLAPDLDKYRGQWVAIKHGKVVSAGKSAVDVIRALEAQGIKGAALHRVAEERDAAFVL